MLMNIPEEYNDEQERLHTHPTLLPKDLACKAPKSNTHRRSVLADVQNEQTTREGNRTLVGAIKPRKQLAEGASVGRRIRDAEGTGLKPARVTWADVVRSA